MKSNWSCCAPGCIFQMLLKSISRKTQIWYAVHSDLLSSFKTYLGEKFKYVNIDRNDRAQQIEKVLRLLEMAKILYRVKHSSGNGVPLGAQVNEKKFKLLFLDVGLMASACGMTMMDIETGKTGGWYKMDKANRIPNNANNIEETRKPSLDPYFA